MQERANDRRFLSTICFIDESTFTLNNELNVQNTQYWSQENLRVNIPTRTQYPQKIHIWPGTFNNNYPTSTRRHGNFAGVHTLLRILLSSNSAVLINIITGVLPPHFDFVVYYVLCQC
jgi:hypothetical protein